MKKPLYVFIAIAILVSCKKEVAENYRAAVVGTYAGRCQLKNNATQTISNTTAAVQVLIDSNSDTYIILKGDIYDLSVPGGTHLVAMNDTFAFEGGRFKGDSLIYITPDYEGKFTGLYLLKKQ